MSNICAIVNIKIDINSILNNTTTVLILNSNTIKTIEDANDRKKTFLETYIAAFKQQCINKDVQVKKIYAKYIKDHIQKYSNAFNITLSKNDIRQVIDSLTIDNNAITLETIDHPTKSYAEYCKNDLKKMNMFQHEYLDQIVRLMYISNDNNPVTKETLSDNMFLFFKLINDLLNSHFLIKNNGGYNIINLIQLDKYNTQYNIDYTELIRMMNDVTQLLNLNDESNIINNVFSKASNRLLFNLYYILSHIKSICQEATNNLVLVKEENGILKFVSNDGFYVKLNFNDDLKVSDIKAHTSPALEKFISTFRIYLCTNLSDYQINLLKSLFRILGISDTVLNDILNRLTNNNTSDATNNNDTKTRILQIQNNKVIQELMFQLANNIYYSKTEISETIPTNVQKTLYTLLLTSNIVQVQYINKKFLTNIIHAIQGKHNSNLRNNTLETVDVLMDEIFNDPKAFIESGKRSIFNAFYFEFKNLMHMNSPKSRTLMLDYFINYLNKTVNIVPVENLEDENGFKSSSLEIKDYELEYAQSLSNAKQFFRIGKTLDRNIEIIFNKSNLSTDKDAKYIYLNPEDKSVDIHTNRMSYKIYLDDLNVVASIKNSDPTKDPYTVVFDTTQTSASKKNIYDFITQYIINDDDFIYILQTTLHNQINKNVLLSMMERNSSDFLNTLQVLGYTILNYAAQTGLVYDKNNQSSDGGLIINYQTNQKTAEDKNINLLDKLFSIYDITYNNIYQLYDPQSLSILISKLPNANGGLKLLAAGLNQTNATALKSNVKNAENNSVPVFHVGSFIDNIKEHFDRHQDAPIFMGSLFTRKNNDFWKIVSQTFVVTQDKITKPVSQLTTQENCYFSFFNSWLDAGDAKLFLPITFSDKTNIFNLLVDLSKIKIDEYSLLDMNASEIEDLHKQNMRIRLAAIMHLKMLDIAKILFEFYKDDKEKINELNSYINLHEIDISSKFYEFRQNFNNVYSMLKEALISSNTLYDLLVRLQKKGILVDIVDAVDFQWKNGIMDLNENFEFLIQQFEDDSFFERVKQFNIRTALYLNSNIDYNLTNTKGKPILAYTQIPFAEDDKYVFRKSNGLNSYVKFELTEQSAKQLYDLFGIRTEAKELADGSISYKILDNIWFSHNKMLLNYNVKTYEENGKIYISEFLDPKINDKQIYDTSFVTIVNPEFEKFHNTSNLIREDFLMTTVGLAYGQCCKADVESIKSGINEKDPGIIDRLITNEDFQLEAYNAGYNSDLYIEYANQIFNGEINPKTLCKSSKQALNEYNNLLYFAAQIQQNAAMTITMIKRMVIFGGTGHSLIGNALNGTLENMYVACVKDLSTDLITLNGDTCKLEYADGSVRVNPAYHELYANSIPELKHEPIAEKTLTYILNILKGSFKEIKNADLTITNMHVRKSETSRRDFVNDQAILKKMWSLEFANPFVKIFDEQGDSFNNMYYMDNEFNIIKIDSIKFIGHEFDSESNSIVGKYVITEHVTSINNKTSNLKKLEPRVVKIGTLYDFWQAFGGSNSIEFNENEDDFIYSELIFKLMVDKMNSIIIKRSEFEYNRIKSLIINTLQPEINAGNEFAKEYKTRILNRLDNEFKYHGNFTVDRTGVVPYSTLKYYYQPLKYAQINLLINTSALKVGPTNINPNWIWQNNEDGTENPLIYFLMETTHIVEQMNAGHDVEDSHIKEMTLVISALIEMGCSVEEVEEIFETIGLNIELELQDYDTKNVSKDELYTVIVHTLYDAIKGDGFQNISLAQKFIEGIDKDLPTGSKLKTFKLNKNNKNLPFIDNQILEVFQTNIAAKFTADIIRRIFPGLSVVLSPSLNEITIYDTITTDGISKVSTLDELKLNWAKQKGLPKEELSAEYKKYNGDFLAYLNSQDTVVDVGEVELGDVILIGDDVNNIYYVEGYSDNGKSINHIKDRNGNVYARKIGLEAVKELRYKNNVKIIKKRSWGRNLKNKNIQFTIQTLKEDGVTLQDHKFDIWDIDSVKLTNNVNYVVDFINFMIQQTSFDTENHLLEHLTTLQQNNAELYIKLTSKYFPTLTNIDLAESVKSDPISISKLTKSYDALFDKINLLLLIFQNITSEYKQLTDYDFVNLYQLGEINDLKDTIKLMCRWMSLHDYALIDNGYFNLPVQFMLTHGIEKKLPVKIVGNKKYTSFECMIPKMWGDKFRIPKGTSIGEIINNKNFFFEQVNKNIQTTLNKNQCDLFFARTDGDHLHIIFDDGSELAKEKLKNLKRGSEKINVSKNRQQKGTLVYRTINGKPAYILSDYIDLYVKHQVDGADVEYAVVNLQENADAAMLDLLDIYNSRYFLTYRLPSDFDMSNKKSNIDVISTFILLLKGNVSVDKMELLLQFFDKQQAGNDGNAQLAQLVHTSFVAAINFIAARIPAQGMLSFMDMTIAGFIDIDTNVVFVPAMQLFLQGDDYDIDKSYMLGATINPNGTYADWSPFFRYDDFEFFEISNKISIPKGIKYESGSNGYILSKENLEYLKLLENANEDYSLWTKDELKMFINVVNEVTRKSPTVVLSGVSEKMLNLINKHSTVKLHKTAYDNAMKNKIWFNMLLVCKKAENLVSQFSPIEMLSIHKIGAKSTSGRAAGFVSTSNIFTMDMMQYINSIGKACIGISANGAKVASLVLMHFNSKIQEAYGSLNADALNNFIKKYLNIHKGEDDSNINYIVYDGEEQKTLASTPYMQGLKWSSNKNNYVGIDTEADKAIQEARRELEQFNIPFDVFLPISALISASTDNAKELILDKINAGTDLMNLYIYTILLGINFTEMCEFMILPEISLLQQTAQLFIFNKGKSNNSLAKTVNAFLKGINAEEYVDGHYSGSLESIVLNTDNDTRDKIIAIMKSLPGFQEEIANSLNENSTQEEKTAIENELISKIRLEHLLGTNFELFFDSQGEIETDSTIKELLKLKINLINQYLNYFTDKEHIHSLSYDNSRAETTNLRIKKIVGGESFEGFESFDAIDEAMFSDKMVEEVVIEEEEEEDMYEEDFEGGFSSSMSEESKQTNLAIQYLNLQKNMLLSIVNLYLQKASSIQKEPSGTTLIYNMLFNMNTINTLKSDATCITVLAKIGKINQGIEGKPHLRIALRSAIEEYVNKLFNKLDDSYFKEHNINKNFNLLQFLESSEEVLDRYIDALYEDKIRQFVNILDVLRSNKHFKKMWSAYNVVSNIIYQYALTAKLTEDTLLSFKKRRIISTIDDKAYKIVSQFFNRVVINKFAVNELYNLSLSIKADSQKQYEFYYYNNDENDQLLKLNAGQLLDLSFANHIDIRTFIRWMNENIVYELKRCDIFKNNAFVNQLIPSTHKGQLVLQFNMDMQDKLNPEYDIIKQAFNSLSKIKLNDLPNLNILVTDGSDITLGDLFFLYNLFVNQNGYQSHMLTNLFEDQLDDPKSLLHKFHIFEGNISLFTEHQLDQFDFDERDLIFQLTHRGVISNNNKYMITRDGDIITFIIKNSEDDYEDKVIFNTDEHMMMPFLSEGLVYNNIALTQITDDFMRQYASANASITNSDKC